MNLSLVSQANKYILNSVKAQDDSLYQELLKNNIITLTKNNEEIINMDRFTIYYKVEPIIYNPNLSEIEIVNLLQNFDLNEVLELIPYEQYLGKNLDKLELTEEQKQKIILCAIYRDIFGISKNDEYIKYLLPNYMYEVKLNTKISNSNKPKIRRIKANMDKTHFDKYTLASYYHEIDDIVNYVRDLNIIDFSDIIFTLGDKQVTFPSPLQYINAATIVGISCQEVSPGGVKTFSLPKDPNSIMVNNKNSKEEQRIPTDLVKAKMFELMLNANFNPFTSFAINDYEVSYGHTQAVENTYDLLISEDLSKLNEKSISKFFDFFDKKSFLKLSSEQKGYLQIPINFEECTSSKDQILFTYYLGLYNISKFISEYMNPKKNVSERTFILVNSFSKASEAERFRFVSAVTAAYHHIGEPEAKALFLKEILSFLPRANNNEKFEEVLESMTLDKITDRYITRLKEYKSSSASRHAKSSMNVGEIVSRWYVEEELVSATTADSISSNKELKREIGDSISSFFSKLFKRDLDNTVCLKLDESPVEKIEVIKNIKKEEKPIEKIEIIKEVKKEELEFNCTFGGKRRLMIQSTKAKNDIYGHSKNEDVEYYTFSYPQWASPYYALIHVLKESPPDVDLITHIHKFNNLDINDPKRKLRSTGGINPKDPMRTAQVFWIPIDYVKIEGPELGEIIIHNNTQEKTIKALEEFCIGGASEENLRIIQLTSNIFSMYEPNDRLLIPYSLLKAPYQRKIDENSK